MQFEQTRTWPKITKIDFDDILCVYSGKPNKCYCGCSGKYYYSSKHIEKAGQARGYKIAKNKIDDVMVEKIIKIINRGIEKGKEEVDTTYVAVEKGNKIYICYFTEKWYHNALK